MEDTIKISGGLYLVIDPSPGAEEVLPRVEAALQGGASTLQIWNNWNKDQDSRSFIDKVCMLAQKYTIPVLINEDYDLLKETGLHGIHFDEPRMTPGEVRALTGRPILYGLTCGNDMQRIRWAVDENADYISFCAMYPSLSVSSCDIVSLESVRQARTMCDFPIFASGGITPENAVPVLENGADGIAVISGILKSEDPKASAQRYVQVIESVTGKRQYK
ncbi:thiamine phosphate synthase [candidate division KSB1 bacterium]